MGDSSQRIGGRLGDSGALELTGKVMVVAIISIFFAVAFVFLIHFYTRWLGRRDSNATATPRRRRRRFDFAGGYQEEANAAALSRGLDPSVLKTIPVVKFNPKEFKDGLECAVCLSQVSEGEKTRLLPKCNHGFHVDCIDMWFHSHSTCPLCRNPVSKPTEETSESANLPANVLFWGDQTRVSTLGPCLQEPRQGPISAQLPSSSSSSLSLAAGKELVIEIPREIGGEEDEEHKSSTMRSLKRLLSRGKRVTPGSPNLDVEEGGRSQS
ncbi:PREDICTED: RING-H2 finger protein ATL60-like [Ipomoea nil]|uniref:RING-H2 finger protein ATL60-like n=1 Tax=Ipomoea nil TaxID=35883 RepID=UPI00090124F9|nr:PREDICTED: RING-H2 finger protein ATL60-like [Ipomoea nil]XP_019196247.1 PREDICTED: RING-H2 finger protein ATL60-like [Ipomoea nil]